MLSLSLSFCCKDMVDKVKAFKSHLAALALPIPLFLPVQSFFQPLWALSWVKKKKVAGVSVVAWYYDIKGKELPSNKKTNPHVASLLALLCNVTEWGTCRTGFTKARWTIPCPLSVFYQTQMSLNVQITWDSHLHSFPTSSPRWVPFGRCDIQRQKL